MRLVADIGYTKLMFQPGIDSAAVVKALSNCEEVERDGYGSSLEYKVKDRQEPIELKMIPHTMIVEEFSEDKEE